MTSSARVLVQLRLPHVDARGGIQELGPLELPVSDVQVISSRKGAIRGNHRHRCGWHYCYVVSGAFDYRTDSGPGAWPPERIAAGQMVYTPPGVAHVMVFVEDTVMVVLGDRRRDQQEYEADLEHVHVV